MKDNQIGQELIPVEVEWMDAQSGFSSPLDLDELESVDPIITHSVGYLLKEDKTKVILGFMMWGEQGTFKHWQLIPKGMIRKITKLKEVKDVKRKRNIK